jgi:hypothetical protein
MENQAITAACVLLEPAFCTHTGVKVIPGIEYNQINLN